MPALLVRAHETDTNAWYPVAPISQPRASAVRGQRRGINAHHRLRRERSESRQYERIVMLAKKGKGQEMTKHEVSRKGTLAQRNDMSESSCEKKGRGTRITKHEVSRKGRMAQRTVVRLRMEQCGEWRRRSKCRAVNPQETLKQEKNLDVIGRKHKGGWEAVNR
jgi:hypothetical protein